jgi:hypothetical protein
MQMLHQNMRQLSIVGVKLIAYSSPLVEPGLGQNKNLRGVDETTEVQLIATTDLMAQ